MEKFVRHIKLHIVAYFIPLLFVFVLSTGAAGISMLLSRVPADQIKFGFIQAAVKFTKSMLDNVGNSNNNKNKNAEELIKLEGRRRKNDWKDTSSEYAWTWRCGEEGERFNYNPGRYRIKYNPREFVYHHEPLGDKTLYDHCIYVKWNFHHWVVYFMVLFGAIAFFNGFISEVSKVGF